MLNAIDYAKFFISQNIGADGDNLESNMKLQKLLLFADMISLVKQGTPLFSDTIYAFEKGCVIENVRHKYQYDYLNLIRESQIQQVDYSESDKKILEMTKKIFGNLSADELSDINHQFNFWQRQFNNSYVSDNYKEKADSIVTTDMILEEIETMKRVVDAFELADEDSYNKLIINGVTFFYDDAMTITPELVRELGDFSRDADESAYSIYYDNDILVVY